MKKIFVFGLLAAAAVASDAQAFGRRCGGGGFFGGGSCAPSYNYGCAPSYGCSTQGYGCGVVYGQPVYSGYYYPSCSGGSCVVPGVSSSQPAVTPKIQAPNPQQTELPGITSPPKPAILPVAPKAEVIVQPAVVVPEKKKVIPSPFQETPPK